MKCHQQWKSLDVPLASRELLLFSSMHSFNHIIWKKKSAELFLTLLSVRTYKIEIQILLPFILGRYIAVLPKVYHLTTGHVSRKKKRNIIQKDTCTPKFIAALFTIARTGRQPKCSTAEEWLKTMCYIYIGILLSHKKECNWGSFLGRWMDLKMSYRIK